MNFVITESSLKSILHKLKEQIIGTTTNALNEPKPNKNKKYDPVKALQKNKSPLMIAKTIKNSTSTLGDKEYLAELAFYYIKDLKRYYEVKKYLGQDPFKFIQKFADVNKKYYVQPVSMSMRQINQTKNQTSVDLGQLKNTTQEDLKKLWAEIKKKCGTLTVKNPAGDGHNPNGINIFKKWEDIKGDKLLYTDDNPLHSGTYARVPSDFGWKNYNTVYPYPKVYSSDCIDMAKKYGVGYKNLKLSDAKKNLYKTKDEKQQFSGAYGKMVDSPTRLTAKQNLKKIENFGANYWAQQMLDFNTALAKQKELIPEYCTVPLEKSFVGKKGTKDWGKSFGHKMSMYKSCSALGGLWIYGYGTAKVSCGCRDNSHPQLNTPVKTSTGTVVAGAEIQSQQTSRDWTNEESLLLVADIAGIAAAFVPVVGWAISAGIGLGKAFYYADKDKNLKRAAVEAMFAIMPILNNTKFGSKILDATKEAILNKTPITPEQLDVVNKVLEYDSSTGAKIQDILKKKALQLGKNPESYKLNLLPTAIKQTEQEFHKQVTGFNSKLARKNLLTKGTITTTPKKV